MDLPFILMMFCCQIKGRNLRAPYRQTQISALLNQKLDHRIKPESRSQMRHRLPLAIFLVYFAHTAVQYPLKHFS